MFPDSGVSGSCLWGVRLMPAMRRHILQRFGGVSSLEEIMSEWQAMSDADRGVPVRQLSTWAAQGNFLWSFWWVVFGAAQQADRQIDIDRQRAFRADGRMGGQMDVDRQSAFWADGRMRGQAEGWGRPQGGWHAVPHFEKFFFLCMRAVPDFHWEA
jgi:hypothetical protein